MKITKELVVPNYGLEGTQGKDGLPAIYTTVTNQNIVLNAPYQGLPSDYSKANGSIQVFEGDTEVTQQATYTLKQTLNVAAELDFNKFKVTHVSTDNGVFIVTVKYKEFVSDIMITTNVVRNGQSGLNTHIHKAWSWSADGTDRFTDKYPNENLKLGTSNEWQDYNFKGWSYSKVPQNLIPLSELGLKGGDDVVNSVEIDNVEGLPVGPELTWFDADKKPMYTLGGKRVTSEDGIKMSIGKGKVPLVAKYVSLVDLATLDGTTTKRGRYRLRKVEKSSEPTIYTPSPQDDYENAYPKYEGYYSSHNPVQSTNPSDYTWSVIRGENGVGVKSTVIRYAINTQGDTPPSTGWVSQVPTLIKGQFLWTETTWTYTDNTSEKGYSVTYISKDGNNGTDGIAGKDGVGIKNTAFKYGVSISGTTKPSNWSTNIPAVPEGQFLWTETTWTYTDNTSEKGYSVAKQGAQGPQGDKGQDGQQGPPTGLIESPTIPTEVYQGMLWKNTGNLSGFITDVTYIFRGSKWEKYIFTADNIYADNLAAITATLGDVTGGSFTGGKFINNYDSRFIGDTWKRGSLRIEDGVLKDESEYYKKTTGEVTNTNNFYTLHNSLEQSSTDIKTGQHQVARFSSSGIILTDSVFSGYGSVNLTYQDLLNLPQISLEGINGWEKYATSGDSAPMVERNMRTVTLTGAFKPVTTISHTGLEQFTVCVLPIGYRPKERYSTIAPGSGIRLALINVEPNGAVTISRNRDNNGYVNYNAGGWYSIACSFSAADI